MSNYLESSEEETGTELAKMQLANTISLNDSK